MAQLDGTGASFRPLLLADPLPFFDDLHRARPVERGVLGVDTGMLLREFGEDERLLAWAEMLDTKGVVRQ